MYIFQNNCHVYNKKIDDIHDTHITYLLYSFEIKIYIIVGMKTVGNNR